MGCAKFGWLTWSQVAACSCRKRTLPITTSNEHDDTGINLFAGTSLGIQQPFTMRGAIVSCMQREPMLVKLRMLGMAFGQFVRWSSMLANLMGLRIRMELGWKGTWPSTTIHPSTLWHGICSLSYSLVSCRCWQFAFEMTCPPKPA